MDPVKYLDEIGAAIAALDESALDAAARHNWALVPQMSENPHVVTVLTPSRHPNIGLKARLIVFPDFSTFRDFVIHLNVPDYKLAASIAEFNCFSLAIPTDFRPHFFTVCRPGYAPRKPTRKESEFYAPLLRECLGMMLRIDDSHDLPLAYVKQNSMFARKEISDGVWTDGPLRIPPESSFTYTEQVVLDRRKCETAAALPVAKDEIWQIDFQSLPMIRTRGRNSRFLYLLAAVDARSGARTVWKDLIVNPREPDGLKPMWESLAGHVLESILARGALPAELHLRSQRLFRLLRPLGQNLPFKMVVHSSLPTLDAVVGEAIETQTV